MPHHFGDREDGELSPGLASSHHESVIDILGTSRQLAVGPVAMVALMVAAGVGALAEPGTEEYVALAILLALLIGLIQVGMGVLRLGFLVNFLSHPVISGFTSAAALIIGFSQLQHLLGIALPQSKNIFEILYRVLYSIGEVNIPTLAIGLIGVVAILLLKQWKKTIPSQLLVVAAGIAIVWAFGLHHRGVRILGEVPGGLPAFSMPLLEPGAIASLLPMALAIALVSFMESIAVAKAVVQRHRDYVLDANQELIGLGMANVAGAFFQSFPVTGGFSRTAVNDQAGAKTGLSSFISAALVGIALLFLTPLFTYLPKAILAAVILVAVLGLIDVKEVAFLWRASRQDFAMLLVTFAATLLIGIEQGIATGVILSLAMVIYRSTRPHVAVLGKLPGTHTYRNIRRFPEAEQRDHVLIIRFDSQLYFANVAHFKDTLRKLEEEKPPLKLVVIDAASMTSIDASGIHALKDAIDDYQKRGIVLYLTGVIGPVRDKLHAAGIIDHLGREHFYLDVPEAMACYEQAQDQRRLGVDYSVQANRAPGKNKT